jgi:serine/threonine protein kinase
MSKLIQIIAIILTAICSAQADDAIDLMDHHVLERDLRDEKQGSYGFTQYGNKNKYIYLLYNKKDKTPIVVHFKRDGKFIKLDKYSRENLPCFPESEKKIKLAELLLACEDVLTKNMAKPANAMVINKFNNVVSNNNCNQSLSNEVTKSIDPFIPLIKKINSEITSSEYELGKLVPEADLLKIQKCHEELLRQNVRTFESCRNLGLSVFQEESGTLCVRNEKVMGAGGFKRLYEAVMFEKKGSDSGSLSAVEAVSLEFKEKERLMPAFENSNKFVKNGENLVGLPSALHYVRARNDKGHVTSETLCQIRYSRNLPYVFKNKTVEEDEADEDDYRGKSNKLAIYNKFAKSNKFAKYHEQVSENNRARINTHWAQVADTTRQLVTGLKYLNEKNCVHGDIKPDNIFVSSNTKNYQAVLGDLDGGFCGKADGNVHTTVGYESVGLMHELDTKGKASLETWKESDRFALFKSLWLSMVNDDVSKSFGARHKETPDSHFTEQCKNGLGRRLNGYCAGVDKNNIPELDEEALDYYNIIKKLPRKEGSPLVPLDEIIAELNALSSKLNKTTSK